MIYKVTPDRKEKGLKEFTGRDSLTLYPAGCLTRDKGCGNSLVGLTEKIKSPINLSILICI